MRSELNEVLLIDRYLMRQLSEAEARTFQTRLLTNEPFAEKVAAQRRAHRLIRWYGRKKAGLDAIYRQLLDEPAFAHQIKTIFIG